MTVALFPETADAAVTVSVEPHRTCICPNRYYTCIAHDVLRMAWESMNMAFVTISYTIVDRTEPLNISRDGLRVQFSVVVGSDAANFTSHLLITEPAKWNGSNLTCSANILGSSDSARDSVTVNICVIGN